MRIILSGDAELEVSPTDIRAAAVGSSWAAQGREYEQLVLVKRKGITATLALYECTMDSEQTPPASEMVGKIELDCLW